MVDATFSRSNVRLVLTRFPEHAAAIRRIFLADPGFRNICEEFALAVEGLARFEMLAQHGPRPEVDDYRSVIASLEAEIIALVRASTASP